MPFLLMKKGVSYFGVRRPKWALEDMKELVAAGFTHVLHTYSEEDLQYYRDSMKEIIDGSVELGLKVYTNPWGIGRVFGGEAYSELVAKNTEFAQVGLDGIKKPAVCPNREEFRKFLCEWLDAVAETKAETVFWDEPHFFFTKGHLEIWSCRCDTCKAKFKDKYGFEMPAEMTTEVREFREESLIDFLDFMTKETRKRGKRNCVCMLPPWFPAGIDDWGKIARLEAVDEIASDPYEEPGDDPDLVEKRYRETAERLVKTAKEYGKDCQMWIKNYLIKSGSEEDAARAIKASYSAGIRNIFAWSYRGSEYLSWLRSDDPEKVWKTLCESLSKL